MSRLPTTIGEDNIYGQNIDKCLTDLVVKTGAGVVVGGLFSMLFKRRAWPMILGGGIGIGMAFETCQERFRQHYVNEKIPLIFQKFRNKAEEKPGNSPVQSSETVGSDDVSDLPQSASSTTNTSDAKED